MHEMSRQVCHSPRGGSAISKHDALFHVALGAPFDAGAATGTTPLVPERQLALARFDQRLRAWDRVGRLEFEDVGEVAPEGELNREALRDLGVVADPDVFVDAAGDDPVALDRERRVRPDALDRGRSEDAGRVVVDDPTRQHPHRRAVDGQ